MVSSNLVMEGPAAQELFDWLDLIKKPPLECLIEGPAGTGKTRVILEFIRSYVERFPGVRVLMMRDVRADMSGTVLVEWENEVLGLDHPAVMNGPTREHREKYVFPNRSEVVLGGFNNETKLFSGQYDGIYFNECQQTIERKWETLHRALRAKAGPFRFFVGDCNPDYEGHWLNVRCNQGKTVRIKTRLWHNARFFDSTRGDWTDDGRDYALRLRTQLSGPNLEGLYFGKWWRRHGAIFPEYDSAVHDVHGELKHNGAAWMLTVQDWPVPIEMRWFLMSKDVGTTAPGVLQLWGIDDQNRMFRLIEYYRTQWTQADWCARATPLVKQFRPQAMVCDHDKGMILAMNRAFTDAGCAPICRTADKTLAVDGRSGKRTRIELFRNRLQSRKVFFLKDAIREADPLLQAHSGRPWRTEMELPAYTRAEFIHGEDAMNRADDPDPTADDHGIDAAMYAEVFVWGRSLEASDKAKPFAPGSAGAILGHKRPGIPGAWRSAS